MHVKTDTISVREVTMSLSAVAIGLRHDASEFFSVTNDSFDLRCEVFIEAIVANASSLVWALKMVVVDPGAIDVVRLASTETDEVIQTRFSKCADKASGKCVRAGSTRRIDSRVEHSNLRSQNLKVCFVSRLTPSPEQCNDDKKQPIHPASFHSKIRTKWPTNRGYQEWIHFRARSLLTQTLNHCGSGSYSSEN